MEICSELWGEKDVKRQSDTIFAGLHFLTPTSKTSIIQETLLVDPYLKLICQIFHSAYYGAPVFVQVLKCDPTGPMEFYREVNLVVNNRVSDSYFSSESLIQSVFLDWFYIYAIYWLGFLHCNWKYRIIQRRLQKSDWRAKYWCRSTISISWSSPFL